MTEVATVIGDVIGSRTATDRAVVHAALAEAVAAVNRPAPGGGEPPVTPLRVTVGDEYQGCFATVAAAVRATLRLRLALARSGVEVRHGVGWGEVTVLAEEPRVEDGPGWWAARAAIEAVEAAESRAASRSLRTAYVVADEADPGGAPDPAAVNAALVARDELLARAGGEVGLSVLAGMLAGMTQQQIARELGISASAVSQRIRRDGLAALARVDELLGALR